VIFAREISDSLTSLVKKIDEANGKNKAMGSFVVFLGNEEEQEKKLKELAEKNDIKTTVLTVDNPGGPPNYKIAKDAEVTVLLYVKQTVKANHAFKKGELKEKDVEAIVKDLDKIIPEKK